MLVIWYTLLVIINFFGGNHSKNYILPYFIPYTRSNHFFLLYPNWFFSEPNCFPFFLTPHFVSYTPNFLGSVSDIFFHEEKFSSRLHLCIVKFNYDAKVIDRSTMLKLVIGRIGHVSHHLESLLKAMESNYFVCICMQNRMFWCSNKGDSTTQVGGLTYLPLWKNL